jgi:hypothetical protein
MSYGAAVTGIRSIASALVVAGFALGITSCSSAHKGLAKDCTVVFSARATDAEGTCQGDAGPVHIYGTDCSDGPKLMAAEDNGGGDLAWARVGSAWHTLSEEGTNSSAFRTCSGG